MLGFCTSPEFVDHLTGEYHPERPDRIRAINPKARPETPNWDKLSETSALFVNTYVQGNESQVSHASIWSSTS